MAKEKVVLAYSGGLDTSVCIKYLQEKYGYDVIAMGLDVGEKKDFDYLKEKALHIGACKAIMIDAKELLAEEYLSLALKGNAMYEGKYPLSSALSRPLISKLLVDIAEQEGAVAVAHGCTGKGNDQVRFELSISSLNPQLKVIAPVREWSMTRDEEIEYAKEKNIPIPVDFEKPYSIDANIWGRACEAGVLENPWNEAPEDCYAWTNAIQTAPDTPEYVEITFQDGLPMAINGVEMAFVSIIQALNTLGGKHGVGRIDHIENRLVGIKSREVYECPAAMVLLTAHKELEAITLPREVSHFKPIIEQQLSQVIYNGLWYSPIKDALAAFINETQQYVNGIVKLKLYKGNCMVVGRQSFESLYSEELATYSKGDMFDHQAAEGFIKLWSLPTTVFSNVQKGKKSGVGCE